MDTADSRAVVETMLDRLILGMYPGQLDIAASVGYLPRQQLAEQDKRAGAGGVSDG